MTKVDVFSGLSKEIVAKRKSSAPPEFIQPMLATLTAHYFSNKEWAFEQKYDGERCLAFKFKDKVTLKSRNRKIINHKYPDLVEALTQQKADNFVIDGEIVALNKQGISDFQLLQSRINLVDSARVIQEEKNVPIRFCIFDVMYVDHYDIRNLPFLTRKSILKNLLHYKGILVYSSHRLSKGLEFFKQACKLGWEGLIAKRSKSAYVGIRSHDWLKFKCTMKQELIIIGYTDPQGSRTDFGALLVGYYDNKKLRYAGKVGTGYNAQTLRTLGSRLRKLEIKKCSVSNFDESTKSIHWVKPELVAEFTFAGWTQKNRLRVARYKGMRDDKAAKDVVKE